MKKIFAALLIAGFASTLTIAQEAPSAKDLIKYRQSGYAFMGWNMGKIKEQLKNPASMDKAVVVAAANAIAGIANSGMGALFAPGTEKGDGWAPTKVKPEFFEKPEEVKKIALEYNKAANNFSKVAATGDAKAIGDAFAELGKTCKSCHDQFKNK